MTKYQVQQTIGLSLLVTFFCSGCCVTSLKVRQSPASFPTEIQPSTELIQIPESGRSMDDSLISPPPIPPSIPPSPVPDFESESKSESRDRGFKAASLLQTAGSKMKQSISWIK
jgi:hypothetical protein